MGRNNFIIVRYKDGEIYGCAEKRSDAIHMVHEQLYYKRVTESNFGTLFPCEGKEAKLWTVLNNRESKEIKCFFPLTASRSLALPGMRPFHAEGKWSGIVAY